MKVQDFFLKRPVFTHREFADFLDSEKPRNKRTMESILAYYTRTGRILRIRRGLYATVLQGFSKDTSPVDPYLLAGKLAHDAVVAYHTALEFYGKAYSVYEQFFYLTSHTSRPMKFRSYRFRGVNFPKALRDNHQEFFGINVEERAGISIKVASLERTLVDVFDRPNLCGNWEEIWRSLESVEFFNLEQVVDYTLLLSNSSTAAKVGFFLEQNRDTLMLDETYLKRLREKCPKKPHYLNRTNRKSGRLIKEWNLIVPVEILERSWQEIV